MMLICDPPRTRLTLHRARPELPVVLLSGYSEHELRLRLGSQPIAGFVQKPFGVEALIRAVAAAGSRGVSK